VSGMPSVQIHADGCAVGASLSRSMRATRLSVAAACCSDDASRRRSRFHKPAFAVTTVRNCEATATGLHAAASIQLTNGPQGCGRIARKSDGIWHATRLTKHSSK
jgi:hypothetical protein